MTREDELIAELDLALAALRRVIVRALAPLAQAHEGAPRVPPASKREQRWSPSPIRPPVQVNGISISFSPPRASYNGKTCDLASLRHAQLLSVVAPILDTQSWLDRAAAARKAWPGLAEQSLSNYTSQIIPALSERIQEIGLKLTFTKGYGLSLSSITP